MGLFWFGVISVWGYFGLGLLWFGVILVGLFRWGYFGLGLFHTVVVRGAANSAKSFIYFQNGDRPSHCLGKKFKVFQATSGEKWRLIF